MAAVAKKYVIVCICQVYNELEKGNLERFFKYITPLVDAVVVYDDGSTDGSYEYAHKHTPYVLRGNKNDFQAEISHKQKLLTEALKLSPDFIFYLDADEVLSANAATELQKLAHYCNQHTIDGLSWQKINLWRSHSWKRVDSLYDEGWAVNFWRVTPGIGFETIKAGLHQPLHPTTLHRIEKNETIKVLHYGFASDKQLAYKYFIYKSHGQRGYLMLDRLINEDRLKLKKVPQSLFPKKLWSDDKQPEKRSFLEALQTMNIYKETVLRPRYSIACLIYQSVDWLKFIYEQVLKYTDLTDKEFYFVANDASQEVLAYLRDNYIPHYIWNNDEKYKNEWYINNVYRAWNFAAKQARGDFIIFINSDMGFTPNWVENLFQAYNGKNCVAARLVESGKLRSGQYGIEKNFGRDYASYREEDFQRYATSMRRDTVEPGGLYMPLLIRKDHFLSVGGYPEGNVTPESNIFHPTIARKGETLIAGDVILMEKLKTKDIMHQTAFNAVVYHFQEGEMGSKKTNKQKPTVKVAVCNDLTTGKMGERVLWDFLLEGLPSSIGVDKRIVGEKGNFEEKICKYISTNHPETEIILQNATFMSLIDPKRFTLVFLQDNLRAMNKVSKQQERNLRLADMRVTNSLQTALSYPEYDFEVIPVGVDAELFKPQNKRVVREQLGFGGETIGIFVGNFSEVKGWAKVRSCIEKFPKITWILVSKYEESYDAKNVRIYNKVSQTELVTLLNCADFFIIGSPVETQCLAAIEACLCNIPVIMRNVGIFKDWTEEERTQVGIFGEDFIGAINTINKRSFQPRAMVIAKKLTIVDSIKLWGQLIGKLLQQKALTVHREKIPRAKKPSDIWFSMEFYFRYYILRKLTGRETFSLTDIILLLEKYLPKSTFVSLRTIWRMILKIKTRG